MSADRLAEGLWGDEPPPSAPKMVQLHVSHLRRALDGNDARIVTHGRGYSPSSQTARSTSRAQCEGSFEAARPATRSRSGVASRWRISPTSRSPPPRSDGLDGLRLRAAECAIDADIAAGRHARGGWASSRRYVAEQPLREHLHAQYMLALYRFGSAV